MKNAARCIRKRWEMVAQSSGEFDLGVTFDGDADRALFCDAHGRVVNGDGRAAAARVKCSRAAR